MAPCSPQGTSLEGRVGGARAGSAPAASESVPAARAASASPSHFFCPCCALAPQSLLLLTLISCPGLGLGEGLGRGRGLEERRGSRERGRSSSHLRVGSMRCPTGGAQREVKLNRPSGRFALLPAETLLNKVLMQVLREAPGKSPGLCRCFPAPFCSATVTQLRSRPSPKPLEPAPGSAGALVSARPHGMGRMNHRESAFLRQLPSRGHAAAGPQRCLPAPSHQCQHPRCCPRPSIHHGTSGMLTPEAP